MEFFLPVLVKSQIPGSWSPPPSLPNISRFQQFKPEKMFEEVIGLKQSCRWRMKISKSFLSVPSKCSFPNKILCFALLLMAEKNCPSVAWLSRNNDNRSSGFFTRTCLHTSITICAHSDNHRRHSTPLQPLAPCSQREDILAAAPIRGPFEMDLLCIM